jgi:endoglucanase
MKRILRAVLFPAFFFFSVCTTSCTVPEGHSGYIRAQGTILADENGKEFFIRGIGLGNWLLAEGYMWDFNTGRADRPRRIEETFSDLLGKENAALFWRKFRDVYTTEKDIRAIRDEGFNTVRLPINWRLFMEDSETVIFREEGFSYIDRLLSWCADNGVYAVIDLHGAPGGQTGRNIDDSERDVPELFTQARYRTMTVALWTEIARRYRENTFVLAYDLLNEPLPADTARQFNADLEPLYREITAAIRTVDTNHIITLEGADWSNDWSVFGKPFDGNLLYQFHKYWNSPDAASIRPYLNFRNTYQVPVWCGETGENTDGWYRSSFSLLEKNRIGWAFWPWKKIGKGNNPRTVKAPAGWESLKSYAGSRYGLDREKGDAILAAFLEACLLDRCERNAKVMKALFNEK